MEFGRYVFTLLDYPKLSGAWRFKKKSSYLGIWRDTKGPRKFAYSAFLDRIPGLRHWTFRSPNDD